MYNLNHPLRAPGTIYRAYGGPPGANLQKLIDRMGGIQQYIGLEDVVIVKPNTQWWNQGAANLAALAALVDFIMNRTGGFKGEVVLADNCHRGAEPWLSENAAWSRRFVRNSDVAQVDNMNDLSRRLKEKYGPQFTVCHWLDVCYGSRRVSNPAEGNGYVYCDGSMGTTLISCDNDVEGEQLRSTIMTYPIFKTDQETMVDFKNGVWERDSFTGQPLKWVNFAALNHHSTYCGATSSVKNLFGVVDLSGGPDPRDDGILTGDYFNFHAFAFNKWQKGPAPGAMGKAVGVFMSSIRKPDLNITSAEWVGLSSRTEPPVVQTRAVLVSEDPVALDYHAFKYLLYPNSKLSIHNPDDMTSPVYYDLVKCAEISGGILDEKIITVESYCYRDGAWHKGPEGPLKAKKIWGTSGKNILKYAYLRMLH
ncbi:MAG: hypothetical protein AMJ79_00260 [Phycisphaerae bacterium SM23_30]|nr:MAG: hypothetical protein AMJ79_00260 [Phycisphaerae bacterium SM23_30]